MEGLGSRGKTLDLVAVPENRHLNLHCGDDPRIRQADESLHRTCKILERRAVVYLRSTTLLQFRVAIICQTSLESQTGLDPTLSIALAYRPLSARQLANML